MATQVNRGSGTPATTGTTWATVTSAVDGAAGTNPATYATMTNAVSSAVATIDVSGYNFSATIAANATLNSVTVNVRHFENNTGRFVSIRYQPYDGATAIGTIATATMATAARNDSITFPVTLAQIRSATFKVRVTITGAANTQSRIFSLDHIDVTADYTALVPNTGSGTIDNGWATAAVGAKPPDPLPEGTRALESNVARTTEDDTTRVLESFVVAVPAEGSATVTYTEALAGAGKRTPKAAATTTYTETTAAAGKKAPRSTVTTTYVEATAGVGKRTPKGATTTSHTWATIAQGVKPAVGVKQGSGLGFWTAVPAATGKKPTKATASVVYAETLTVSGKRKPRATVSVATLFASQATGYAPALLIGYFTMAMQFGDRPVVAWQMNGEGATVEVMT